MDTNNRKITDNRNPFKGQFLTSFTLSTDAFSVTNNDARNLDDELNRFENISLDPDIERHLIAKNELLASYAISKAEDSRLTLEEAQNIQGLIKNNKELDFIVEKIGKGEKLTNKDCDKLEFYNISKTFRHSNERRIGVNDISLELIKEIHAELTKGLDIFVGHIAGFTPYRSGRWRDNDLIRVGEYAPAQFKDIPGTVEELVNWFKAAPTVGNVAIFHAALYAIHPFNNGNKRVCRVLEHILQRVVGLNRNNLYASSYYYHTEKPRYYKRLLGTLSRRNLDIFASFALEALTHSIIGVWQTSLEIKRRKFLDSFDLESGAEKILKPLVKRGELRFKNYYRLLKHKVSRQTFVNHLEEAVEKGTLKKREDGKATYYRLNLEAEEEGLVGRGEEVTRKEKATG